ncbi:MAG TPA: neprosin family prolyl endopeptidase [Urbifossiella sp.]|nr:neprosin family prolyl endopeptidase [Urbifossiella sp.]
MSFFDSFTKFRDLLHGAKFGAEVDRCFPEHESRSATVGAAASLSPAGPAGPAASQPVRKEWFAAELHKMLDFLRRFYHDAGKAEHTFMDPSGSLVDCVPFGELATVRAIRAKGGTVVEQGPRPSGFQPQPRKRGFDRPPASLPVIPMLHRGLVDRFGKRLACPDGCVPVARLTTDDMVRVGSFDQFFTKAHFTNPPPAKKGKKAAAKPAAKGARKSARASGKAVNPAAVNPAAVNPAAGVNAGHFYANTNDGPVGVGRGPYFGCATGLSIREPSVPQTHASISQLWLIGDNIRRRDGNFAFQTVESGWMVQPAFSQTNAPVLFVFFNPDGYQSGAAYVINPNDFAHGFVPAPDAPFAINQHGFLIPPAPGGTPTTIVMHWEFFDAPTPGWYLHIGQVGQSPADFFFLGHFPASLYAGTMLESRCQFAQFGGEVGRNTTSPVGFTQMGSGIPPNSDALFNFSNVAFQRDIRVQTTQNAPMAPADLVPLQVDAAAGFDLNIPTDPAFQSFIFFGGGGNV